MKKLIFIFLILFSCEPPEPITVDRNTVFMATSGDVGRSVIIRDAYGEIGRRVIRPDLQYRDPQCDSPYDSGRGYWILHLEPGIYELIVERFTSPWYVFVTITIYENSCNRFNLDQIDKWQ